MTLENKNIRSSHLRRISATCVNLNLKKANRKINLIYDRYLVKADITANQFSILSYIDFFTPISINELAFHMLMERSTLSKNLDPLILKKLVKKEPGKDKRKKMILITKVGLTVLNESIRYWKLAQKEIYETFGKHEVRDLLRSLHKVSNE